MPKLDLGLPSYDSLFSTEGERQEANTEKVMTIPINKIKDFDLDIKKIDQRFYNITGKNILSVVNKSPLNVSPKTKRRNFI